MLRHTLGQPTSMNSPRLKKPRRRLQFSLGWFVAGVLILGPILGIGGPLAIQIVQELRTPRPLPASSIPAAAYDPMPIDYYESGETPLD